MRKNPLVTSVNDPKLAGFRRALTELMVDLATQIVRWRGRQ